MPSLQKWGIVLVIIGVLANNYVYLHDLIFGQGVTQLGPKSIPALIVTVVVIIVGLYLLIKDRGKPENL
jgi:hypothetical protein